MVNTDKTEDMSAGQRDTDVFNRGTFGGNFVRVARLTAVQKAHQTGGKKTQTEKKQQPT